MVEGDFWVLFAMLVYFIVVLTIGFVYAKRSNSSTSEYFIGGRKVGPWLTALSAEASDMSGYLLMGLPGLAYFTGASDAGWTAVGLAIGTYLNWKFVAKRLRMYSVKAGNAITLPGFYSKRFGDDRNIVSTIAALIILAIFILGTLAIGVVIPESKINLLQSLLVAYDDLWASIGAPWLGNIMAVLITFGVLGQVSVVIAGPSTGILAVGKAGYLPKTLQHTNKNGIQTTILYVQAAIVTLLSLVLVLLPSVESAYQILSQMSTIIYLIMVVIIYCAFVRLRRTAPDKARGFKVPGGEFGKWLVTIVGVAGAVVAGVLSFVPPSQIKTGSPVVYVGVLIIGVVVFIAIPLIVYAKRKKSWRDPGASFYPFDGPIEGRKPSVVSRWPKGYQPSDQEIQAAYDKENASAIQNSDSLKQ